VFPLEQLGDKVRRKFGITAFTQLAQPVQQTFAEGSAGGSVVGFDQYAHQRSDRRPQKDPQQQKAA